AIHNLSGPISITALSGVLNTVDINNNAGVNLSTDPILNNLTINSNGSISQTGAWTVVGLTTLNSNSNSITLDQNNDFNQLTVSNAATVSINDINEGLNIVANNISNTLNITATNTVNLQGDAGALAISTTAGDILDSDAITVSGDTVLNTATGDIIFDATGNRLNTITINQANDVTLNNQGAIQIAGNMNTATLTAGLNTNPSNITNIDGSALNVSGQTNLILANGGDINLNNNATHNLLGPVRVTASAGVLNTVDINNNAGVNLSTDPILNNLIINANGDISQTDAWNVAGLTSLDSNNNVITLNQDNDFNRVEINNTRNASLNDIRNGLSVTANAIRDTLNIKATGLVRVQGNATALDISTTAGGIEDSAALIITGNTQLNSENADITFNNNTTNLNTVTITQARNAQLFDLDSLILNAINITDNLNVTAGNTLTLAGTMGGLNATSNTGDIISNGAINVSGDTQLSAANADITLNAPDNDFNTLTIVNANNANITDTNALTLTATNLNNTLSVTTGDTLTISGKMNDLLATVSPTPEAIGGIVDNGPLQVNNRAQFDAGGGDINLSNAANDFNVIEANNARQMNITDANALTITARNISGPTSLIANDVVNISGLFNDLSITTTGGIQNGAGPLISNGLTSLDAGNSDISLTHAANDFNQLEITRAGNTTLNDTNAINLQNINTGDLTLTAQGNIIQAADKQVSATGSASINAGTADINLAGDNLFTTLTLAANNATVVNNQALTLNDSTLGRSLDLTTKNGSLSINQIRAADTIRLNAAEALVNLNNTNENLITNRATLQAGTGIGHASQINTRIASLQALNTRSGDINITNTSARITLDSVVNQGANSGNFNFRTGEDVFINNITLRQDLRQAFLTNSPATSGTGTVNMFSTRGSFLGSGTNTPDIRATNLLVIGLNGTLGTIARPLVLDISGTVELALRASLDPTFLAPAPAPADIRNTSFLPFISANVLNAVTGLTVIGVENLLDINIAIFTDLNLFSVSDEPVLLPKDQWWENGYTVEEDEEYFRQTTGQGVIGHGEEY
ncbi:hypothetical protein MNBD_GAMMA10-1625, partial [hydrothermal vent metagenome]